MSNILKLLHWTKYKAASKDKLQSWWILFPKRNKKKPPTSCYFEGLYLKIVDISISMTGVALDL